MILRIVKNHNKFEWAFFNSHDSRNYRTVSDLFVNLDSVFRLGG